MAAEVEVVEVVVVEVVVVEVVVVGLVDVVGVVGPIDVNEVVDVADVGLGVEEVEKVISKGVATPVNVIKIWVASGVGPELNDIMESQTPNVLWQPTPQ